MAKILESACHLSRSSQVREPLFMVSWTSKCWNKKLQGWRPLDTWQPHNQGLVSIQYHHSSRKLACYQVMKEREQWVLQYHARILSGEFDKESGELSHARDVIGNSWIKFRRPFIGYKLFGSIRDSDCFVSFIHFKWAFSNKHVWNKVIQLDTS